VSRGGGDVPIRKSVARFNRRVTNHVTGPFAKWLPGFGVILHTGRRSQRRYRTPVNVFAVPHGYVVALNYGPDSDWVKNVLAAGGCEVERRGRTEHVTAPQVFHDESRREVPPIVRLPLRLLGVSDFMRLAPRAGAGLET
jgi:deazaflavin-dependent oxidoreductase (nitroreductase family)